MVFMMNHGQFFTRHIGCILFTICYCEVLTFSMHKIFTNFTMGAISTFFKSFSTYITKFAFMVALFGPAVGNGVLDEVGCYTGTG